MEQNLKTRYHLAVRRQMVARFLELTEESSHRNRILPNALF